tara:strand:+ start:1441 stop:2457 length:1017 start_codon:yes stop_codon:yes gene_type:complete
MAEGIESLANPEDLELARKAAEQMGDAEYMYSQQQLLPENMRRGTPLGFVSDMGYDGDYPQTGRNAEVISYGMPGKEDREAGTMPYLGSGDGLIQGLYVRKNRTPQAVKDEFGDMPVFNLNPAKPGSVLLFNSPEYKQLLENRDNPERTGKESVANTLNHELFHRGAVDVLPLPDLTDYALNEYRKSSIPGMDFIKEDRTGERAAIVFRKLKDVDGQHRYLDALDKLNIAKGDITLLTERDQMRVEDLIAAGTVGQQFFNTQAQEDYMVRTPSPALETPTEYEPGIAGLMSRIGDLGEARKAEVRSFNRYRTARQEGGAYDTSRFGNRGENQVEFDSP